MALFTSVIDVSVVHDAYRTTQEIATFLRANENNDELKVFYAHLTAYCLIIRDHWGRICKATVRIDCQLYARLLERLDCIVAPTIFKICQVPTSSEMVGEKLRTLIWYWDKARKSKISAVKREIIQSCLNFGGTLEKRNEFIQALAESEEEIRTLYPEDLSEWMTEDLTRQKTIREPPYAVQTAAQSVFKALTACKGCLCNPTHDFSARICLGTYRKPQLETQANVDHELDFDLFLSMMEEWHEARVHTAREAVVHFAVSDGADQSRFNKRERAIKPMKVKRLCEQIAKIKTMAAYRLDLKVIRDQLFKLQSQKSNSLFDTAINSVSLQQILEGRSRSFTEKARRVLAVILSSSVLHLLDTPWLQPTWSSNHVLFFRTASGAVPLRPLIQIQLSSLEHGQFSLNGTAPKDYNDEQTDSDDIDPDDIDPDDLVRHQCPTLISLAVILMEVYFGTPFEILAGRYGVELGPNAESPSCTRYIDTNLVFEACRGEIPENCLFLYAIDKCLDPTIWEGPDGNKLDNETLRTKIYEEVVRPLESELIQAYSSIPIDDLDKFAESLDFASWDQTIQPWNRQMQHDTQQGHLYDTVRTSSPFSGLSASCHTDCSSTDQSSFGTHYRYPESLKRGHSSTPLSAPSPRSDGLPLTVPSVFKFFDDETISETYARTACQAYVDWRLKYHEVYNKHIPTQLESYHSVPVKVALLDTGLDLRHPHVEARIENIKGKYNWLQEKFRQSIHDLNGHGTFTANLILDYAPDAELYIAKIAENKPSCPKTIAEAINYAVSEWKVDIISMSFGFPTCDTEDYIELENALANAYANKVLLFAAASNDGGRLGRSFPAREPTVIAVHATDTYGNRSSFSPTATDDDISIATVGEAVESAWPVHLCDEEATDQDYVKYKSGTSYATPIAAGIAAFLLLYARIHIPTKADALKSYQRMKAVLRKVAEKGINHTRRDGYHFIDLSLHTDSLFGKEKEHIDSIITDLIR
ncbi:pfs domain-containing protein [Xylaria flabelliformis]|nr:pfs domain-containing protein [Xylaria flabelliformis]